MESSRVRGRSPRENLQGSQLSIAFFDRFEMKSGVQGAQPRENLQDSHLSLAFFDHSEMNSSRGPGTQPPGNVAWFTIEFSTL